MCVPPIKLAWRRVPADTRPRAIEFETHLLASTTQGHTAITLGRRAASISLNTGWERVAALAGLCLRYRNLPLWNTAVFEIIVFAERPRYESRSPPTLGVSHAAVRSRIRQDAAFSH